MVIKNDIISLIEYILFNEKKHYEESNKPEDHIYLMALRVKNWLNSPSCPLVDEDELD